MGSPFEIEFIFIGAKINVSFEDGFFDDDEKKEIQEFVHSISKEIAIDKSYVECKQNKRKSTFLIEEGWNSLKDMLFDTEFGKYLDENNQNLLVDTYATIIKCYIYEYLSTEQYAVEHIGIEVDQSCKFIALICKDASNSWRNYPGKWQTWNFDSSVINKNKQ